jgi:hypothetical protein
MSVESWQMHTYFPYLERPLTPVSVLSLFDEIRAESLSRFFEKWVKANDSSDLAVCFDFPRKDEEIHSNGPWPCLFCHAQTKIPLFFSIFNPSASEALRQEAYRMGVTQAYTLYDNWENPISLSEKDSYAVRLHIDLKSGARLEKRIRDSNELFIIRAVNHLIIESELNFVKGWEALFMLSHNYGTNKNLQSLTEYLIDEIRRNNIKPRKLTEPILKNILRDIKNYGYASIFFTDEMDFMGVLKGFYIKDQLSTLLPAENPADNLGRLFASFLAGIILASIDRKICGTGVPIAETIYELDKITVFSWDEVNCELAARLSAAQIEILRAIGIDAERFGHVRNSAKNVGTRYC